MTQPNQPNKTSYADRQRAARLACAAQVKLDPDASPEDKRLADRDLQGNDASTLSPGDVSSMIRHIPPKALHYLALARAVIAGHPLPDDDA